jgi:hypothetical protein
MRRSLRIIAWCVFTVMFGGQVLAQQLSIVGPTDWTAVISLTSGSEVQVDLVSGQRATGRFVSATADDIHVAWGGAERTFAQRTVRRVVLVGRRQTGKYAKRGLLVGGLAGGLVGALAPQEGRVGWSIFTAGLWGAVGAGAGAMLGYSQRQETVVYVSNVPAH